MWLDSQLLDVLGREPLQRGLSRSDVQRVLSQLLQRLRWVVPTVLSQQRRWCRNLFRWGLHAFRHGVQRDHRASCSQVRHRPGAERTKQELHLIWVLSIQEHRQLRHLLRVVVVDLLDILDKRGSRPKHLPQGLRRNHENLLSYPTDDR